MSAAADTLHGYEEGAACLRNGCSGIIESHPSKNCSCHISPPCSNCTNPRNFCPDCDWQEADDVVAFNHIANVDRATGVDRIQATPRPLDNSKIDYRRYSHSSCSMLVEGVYPEGTTSAEVAAIVQGTFGGRFEQFGNGRFRYVAYTD